MAGLFIPIALTLAALITAVATYRGIKRGGARYYTLEREALLRRAMFTLFTTVVFFSGAVGWLVYERQQLVAPETAVEEEGDAETVETALTPAAEGTPELNNLPPLPTETPTPGPTEPPTAVPCRGVVEGTQDNGLTLREAPGGAEILVLAEATIVTVLIEEGEATANGLVWLKVRSLTTNDEGWVAADFLTLGAGCE